MSNPDAVAKAPTDPRVDLKVSLAGLLIPLFQGGAIDAPLARQMAIDAIEAYDPETRADFVNAARTIALSMTALALLGAAASPDMTMAEKMRASNRANALSRSADQTERTMMQRRRDQQANPSTGKSATEPAEPDIEADVAAIEAGIAKMIQEYCTAPSPTATRASPPKPPAAPAAARSQPAPAQNPFVSPATTPATAIHHRAPAFDAALFQSTAFKEMQLRSSAIQRVAALAGANPPR
jgi:hypothetical protein